MGNKIKFSRSKIVTYVCLALSLVSTFSYMIYTIINSSNLVEQLGSIISVIMLMVFCVIFIIGGLYIDNTNHKVGRIFVVVGSILLTVYSIFNILIGEDVFSLKKQDTVLNFYDMNITDVVRWAEKRKILVEQSFENSDNIEQYKIISQDVEPGTLTKKIKKIAVIVSDGPNLEKEAIIPDMTDWGLDKVIKYIDDNYLSNVKISFEFNKTVEKDIIFYQDVKNASKRNDEINLKCSLGVYEDLKNVTMQNLVGLDTFHAIIFLQRNAINYEIQYAYSDDKDEGIVLKQSVKKWDIIDPKDHDKVIITVAKKDEITVPDLTKMSLSEITSWATENKLKLEFKEEYDDTIKSGRVISTKPTKNSTVEINSTIIVTTSKGQIHMTKFTNVDDFKKWAEENDIIYTIEYQFNSSVDSGKLISSSHKENQIIKNTDTVKLLISQGGNTIIPSLIGMNKDEALKSCNKANLKCNIIYEDNSSKKDIVVKQAMRSGSNVPVNTSINLTVGK